MVHELLAPGPQEGYDLDASDKSLPRLQDWMKHHGDICRVPTKSRSGHSRRGEPINLARDLSELTLNIVLHALFSAVLSMLMQTRERDSAEAMPRLCLTKSWP
jgi:hypothetical protein